MIRKKLGDDTRGMFLIIDLDRLKHINDQYGHKEGDRAIISLAKILKAHFRSSDIVGRIGGDEFVTYLPAAAGNADIMSETFRRLLENLRSVSVGEKNDVQITCSIGCVIE